MSAALERLITKVESWLHLPNVVLLTLSLVAGSLLLAWALFRLRRPPAPAKQRRSPDISTGRMAVTGAAFGITVLATPSYLAVVTLNARTHSIWMHLLVMFVWFLMSELLLVAVVVDACLPGANRISNWLGVQWPKWEPKVSRAATWLIALAGLMLIADGIVYLATGRFLLGS